MPPAAAPAGPLAPLLQARGVVVLDGGLATELERRGARLEGGLWSAGALLDAPRLVREVHLSFFLAGADLATTASYQASVDGFARRGLDRTAALAVMREAVRLAQDARREFLSSSDRPGPGPLIAGSIGPYGAVLGDGSEYRGGYDLPPARLEAFHLPRLEALLEAGVDVLAVETMPSPGEALGVLRLLERWTDARAWVSFTCRDARHTGDGTPLRHAVRDLAGHPCLAAVGVNCLPPALVEEALEEVGAETTLPLVAYPNSGEHWDAARRAWTGSAGVPAAAPARWFALGARLIGGCCRTGPAMIRAVREALAAPASAGP